MSREVTRLIDKIIVHCSDSDFIQHDDISVIKHWHVDERGFDDVGYHYFIKKDGTVQTGRVLNKIGAHCKGQNRKSIGVCLSGKHKFTSHQFEALHDLILKIWGKLGKDIEVFGHYDFSSKTCPNFNVDEFLYYHNLKEYKDEKTDD